MNEEMVISWQSREYAWHTRRVKGAFGDRFSRERFASRQ